MQTTIVECPESVTSDEGATSDRLCQLCRFCAEKKSCMIPIFREQGLIDDLPSKIKAYVPIEVSEDDTLPLQVCSPCVQHLTMWHEFITGCLKADEKLRAIYQEMLKTKADRGDPVTVAEERDKQQITEGRTCIQQQDGRALSTEELAGQNKADAATKTGSYDRSSATIGQMDTTCSAGTSKICSHQLAETENKIIDTSHILKLKSTCDKSTFMCDQCGKTLASLQTLRAHLRIHSGERPYTCQICGIRFTARSGVKRHEKEVHEGVKDHVCQLCDRAFANRQTLRDHIRIHTGERPHGCETCNKAFKTKAALYVHKKCHTAVKTHTCPVCGKQFCTKTVLERHKQCHTGERPHCCDACGKSFYTKYDLKKHKLTHKTEKPFVCPHCFCSFKQMKYLKTHMKNKSCKLEHVRASLDSDENSENISTISYEMSKIEFNCNSSFK